MNSKLQAIVLQILRPLARLLVRRGMAFGEFSQLARQAYVDAAAETLQNQGEKATHSRIAIATGLTRKEVSQLRQSDDSAIKPLQQRYNRGVRVISGWLNDPEFCTASPPELSLAQFEQLVARYSGDMPYRAMLKELIHSGVVAMTTNDSVVLLTDAYVPQTNIAEKLAILGQDVSLLIKTIEYNLQDTPELEPRFQRKVSYDNLPLEAVHVFRQLASQNSMALLVQLNAWLAQHDRDSNPEAQGTGRFKAGVGIYYFEEAMPPTPLPATTPQDDLS